MTGLIDRPGWREEIALLREAAAKLTAKEIALFRDADATLTAMGQPGRAALYKADVPATPMLAAAMAGDAAERLRAVVDRLTADVDELRKQVAADGDIIAAASVAAERIAPLTADVDELRKQVAADGEIIAAASVAAERIAPAPPSAIRPAWRHAVPLMLGAGDE
jgi:hypothetical protein